jgi:hypothetical protein
MAARDTSYRNYSSGFLARVGETPPSFRQMRQLEGLFVLWTEAMPGEEQWLTAELVLTDANRKRESADPGGLPFTVYYISN